MQNINYVVEGGTGRIIYLTEKEVAEITKKALSTPGMTGISEGASLM